MIAEAPEPPTGRSSRSVGEDLARASAAGVLPSIQVRPEYPGDDAMSAGRLERAVQAALARPSRGVVFWSRPHLAQEPEKMAVLKAMASRR